MSGEYAECENKALRVITSPNDPTTADSAITFLQTIAATNPPWLTYAIVGTKQVAYPVFTGPTHTLEDLQKHVLTFYPEAAFDWHDTTAELNGPAFTLRLWHPKPTDPTRRDYPLDRLEVALLEGSFFNPIAILKDYNPDPFAPLLTTIQHLDPDEAVCLAVSFRPASKLRTLIASDVIGVGDYGAYSNRTNNRDLLPMQQCLDMFPKYKSLSSPMWDVDIFTLCYASTPDRAQALTDQLTQHLLAYDLPWPSLHITYRLQPFDPDTEPTGHELWCRDALNTAELAGLVHFPHKSVASEILMGATKRLKPVPDHLTQPPGLSLGENEHFGTTKPVYLPHARRGQHIYVVGASGSGKSAHMCNLMKQDIDEGCGFALLDPHGDLAERVLTLIPEERAADVVYFNPTDREHITPLNVFAGAKNPQELVLIADGVIVTFRRLVESWGDRMENILRQTVYTLLAVGNKTFADIQRMLSDPPFREQVVAQLTNPPLKRFWQYDFPNLPKNACDPITNKFSKFLNPLDPTRFIFSVPETKLDFSDIMQGRKIFLANLAQGQLGEDFSQLLGALLVSQFQLSATRRAAIPEEARTPFTLYVDEFQNFTSGDPKSFEKILSEARKYKLQLVLAHQFTSQLPTGVTDAILGNVYTQIVFRVGLKDAALLQHSFTALTPDDLQNLDIGNALTRCGKSEDSFSLKTRNYPSPPATNPSTRIQAHSRDTYSIPVQQAYDHEDAQYKQAAAAADTPADEEILGRT